MKLLKLLKRLAFGLLGAVMAVLVTATVLEKIYGTDFAAAHIYGAGWFAALWGALTLAAPACSAGNCGGGPPSCCCTSLSRSSSRGLP